MGESSKVRRGLIYAIGFVVLAVAPVVALNSLANADPGAGGYGYGAGEHHHPHLTDAQRQCLTDHGATLPKRGADGSVPQLTPEQREALRNAAAACGLEWHLGVGGFGLPHHAFGPTSAQLQCLSEQGVTLPQRAPDGSHPHLNQDQINALRNAAAACGIQWRHGPHTATTRGMV